MLQTFRNAWKNEELRKRIIYTLAILVIYRLGCAVPVPFVKASALSSMFGTGSMLNYLNMMSGGALSQCTLFALGVTPYINASIIMQLLTVAIPYLENLAKEPDGQDKMKRINHYAGAVIGLILSIGYYFMVRSMNGLSYTKGFGGVLSAITIILCFTAGSQLITWLGEQIDDKGIGNGISLLIFTGIVSRWSGLYGSVNGLLVQAQSGKPQYYIILPLIAVLAVLAIAFIVFMTAAERRLMVMYAKRVVGRKMMGGQSSYIPLKVNMSGVMPIIFASALCSIPGTIGSLVNVSYEAHPIWYNFFKSFNYNSWLYVVIYSLLIFGFNYFYVAIQYNPVEIANNLRKNNGTLPGIRPGKPTSDFITKALNKITVVGSVFLIVVAIMPIILGNLTGVSIQLGGTSMLILVGVALDTARSLDSYMVMRSHKGFLD